MLTRNDYLWRRYAPLLSADDGTSAGGAGDESPAEDAGTPGGEQGGDEQPEETTEPYAKFPDADSFKARMDREARSRLTSQAKDLGYESVDDMLAAAKSAREQQEAEKTEAQKLGEQLHQAQQEKDAALERANTMLKRAAITAEAAKLGVIDPDAAYALMDQSGLEIDDTGSVAGVSEALTALLEAKPYLKANQQTATASGADFSSSTNQHNAGSMTDIIRGAAGRSKA